MTAQSFETLTPTRSLLSRFVRSLPIIGRVIREVEREIDTVYYLLVIFLTALVLAVQTWGLPALVVTAIALVPVIFVLLIWVTLP
jgi:hypothetical protein